MKNETGNKLVTLPQLRDFIYIGTFIITVASFWFGLSNKIDLLSQRVDNFIELYRKTDSKVDQSIEHLYRLDVEIQRIKSKIGFE